MSRVRKVFQSEILSRRTSADPLQRQTVQLLRLREILHPEIASRPTSEDPHGREALLVSRVRQMLPLSVGSYSTQENPHGGEALPLLRVRKIFHLQVCSYPASEDPQWREALSLLRLRQMFHAKIHSRQTQKSSRGGRKLGTRTVSDATKALFLEGTCIGKCRKASSASYVTFGSLERSIFVWPSKEGCHGGITVSVDHVISIST